MTINRNKCKPCPTCRGVGKTENETCERCGGYGSVALKVISRRKTWRDYCTDPVSLASDGVL